MNDSGATVAKVEGIFFRRFAAEVSDDWLYKLEWDASPLPVPSQLSAYINALMPTLSNQIGLEAHEPIEKLSTAYVIWALQDLGFEFTVGAQASHEQIRQALGIPEHYSRLLHRFLMVLSNVGLVAFENNQWVVIRAPQADDFAVDAETLIEQFPAYEPQIVLVEQCGRNLADALVGKVDPLSLLFPGGSTALSEKLYRDVPQAIVFNGLIGQVAAAASQPASWKSAPAPAAQPQPFSRPCQMMWLYTRSPIFHPCSSPVPKNALHSTSSCAINF